MVAVTVATAGSADGQTAPSGTGMAFCPSPVPKTSTRSPARAVALPMPSILLALGPLATTAATKVPPFMAYTPGSAAATVSIIVWKDGVPFTET